ncbi:hypothetical protein AAFC00_001064 [Neodothiora populina]|uniref:C3H1-type domain-containing protein n=1 Tax=Neodothiora populina TaxID=2781224 RepID=A0ABR3PMP9_9PEZI
MSVEVQSGTPLAEALQNVVGPKLAEAGWTSGAVDDNSLTEYIILMLVNGKTQEQIASELAADLLGLPPDEPSTHEFARWLFEQVHVLGAQLNRGSAPQAQQQPSQMSVLQSAGANMDVAPSQDTAMAEGNDASPEGSVPTGPKSMRNGNAVGNQRGGGRRMLGQLNRAMDRKTSDATLHRIRSAAGGVGRINTHGSREPPKGPRSMGGRMANAMGSRPGMSPMGAMGAMPGMNPGMAQNMMNADPQQQMQLLKLLEEQSRMMAQILGPQAQQMGNAPAINPAFFPQPQQQQQGKSLFDRVDRKGPRQNNSFGNNRANRNASDAMDTDTAPADGEASGERKDPSEVPCRFQLSCTNPTCHFGHQSPAAPPGITLDLSDKCSYGAACKNNKCAASHPSPAQKRQHLATTVDCKFYPNCTNPNCPFKHPDNPPCRNGADCPERDSGCTYSHSDIVCRYDPCLNPKCPYRHADGQKRGNFNDKVWTREGFNREGAEQGHHVSERQFVADDVEEELILPGRGDGQNTGGMDVEGETGENHSSATEGRASPESLEQSAIVT